MSRRKLRSNCKPFPIEEAVMLYNNGASFRDLGCKYGLEHPNVLFRFRRLGIPYRTRREAMQRIESRNKISIASKGRRMLPESIEKIRQFHLGRKRNMETRFRLSGPNHPNWQGGKATAQKRIRQSVEAKEWKKAVFIRDNYTCQHCGARSGNGRKVILNADHIKPFSIFIELRFDLGNGRTLCEPCHRKTPTWGIAPKKQIQHLAAADTGIGA